LKLDDEQVGMKSPSWPGKSRDNLPFGVGNATDALPVGDDHENIHRTQHERDVEEAVVVCNFILFVIFNTRSAIVIFM